jgi:hypothetical protein
MRLAQGAGYRDADARRLGADRSEAEEQRLERRLDASARSDAKITKMKDHRTHLAHRTEHAVDLETGAVVAVTVQDVGDTGTSIETMIEAAEQIEAVVPAGDGLKKSSPTRAITVIR